MGHFWPQRTIFPSSPSSESIPDVSPPIWLRPQWWPKIVPKSKSPLPPKILRTNPAPYLSLHLVISWRIWYQTSQVHYHWMLQTEWCTPCWQRNDPFPLPISAPPYLSLHLVISWRIWYGTSQVHYHRMLQMGWCIPCWQRNAVRAHPLLQMCWKTSTEIGKV